MRRFFMLSAALAIAASGATLALSGSQAWAKGGPNGKMTCSGMNGTASGTITISGCVDTGSATATQSQPLNTTALATGGTVTWTNGTTSTFAAPVLVSIKAKKCPGYIKSTKKAPVPAANEPTADKYSGSVTADTSGLKIPGKYKGEVCISTGGNVTSLKALKVS